MAIEGVLILGSVLVCTCTRTLYVCASKSISMLNNILKHERVHIHVTSSTTAMLKSTNPIFYGS